MNSKPQLHVSMLNDLAMCGIKFRRRYGKRFGIWPVEEKTPTSLAAIIGISVHKAAEENYLCKIETGNLLALADVVEAARTEFGQQASGEIRLDDEEAANPKLAIDHAIDMTVALTALHATEVAPLIRPVAVEQQWVIELQDYDFDLAGQIDLVAEGEIIRDLKTKGKTPPPNEAQSVQMAMYSTAYKVLNGHYPKGVALDCLIKNKTPKYIQLTATPDPSWINPLFRRIDNFCQIIKAEKTGLQVLAPADPTHWICSKKFCPYTSDCEFWSGR